MNTVNLIFAVHNHQPIGNFDHVFEDVYQKSYKPFLEVVEKFPSIKVTQHYTGILLEWLIGNHPEFIEKLKYVIARGQVELLTGSYYEAILSIIPPLDRIHQIEKLTNYITDIFDYHPQGMWLAERVWEQAIVKEISEAGVNFLSIDEAHFMYAGLQEHALYGYYTTEEQGRVVNIFPGSKKLRYTIPFAPVEETINWLRSRAADGGKRIAVFADDGEKFGAWPNTYQHVYENKWLENFFAALVENNDWIKTIHFAEAVNNIAPIDKIYLPTASYPEMLKWALPYESAENFEEFENELKHHRLERYEVFVRGGYWRNFLAKYPEANWMHKKMLRVSKKIKNSEDRGNNVNEAKQFLLAGQCNDAYWHGVFGGLYLPNLRYPIYRSLIQAENCIDKIEDQKIAIEVVDADCDGKMEVIVETPASNVYIKPDMGGAIFEYDYRPKRLNILDIVSRRPEASHKKLLQKNLSPNQTQESNLHEFLIYDKYQHASLIDHFFNENTTVDDFVKMNYNEIGSFVFGKYDVRTYTKNNTAIIELVHDGTVNYENTISKIQLIKKIFISHKSSEITVEYKLINREINPLKLRFGVEWNYGLMAGDAPDRYYEATGIEITDRRLKSIGSLSNINKLSLVDEWLKIRIDLETENPAEFWRCPVETVSLSEAGLEKVYQSSTVIPVWNIELRDNWQTQITQRIFDI